MLTFSQSLKKVSKFKNSFVVYTGWPPGIFLNNVQITIMTMRHIVHVYKEQDISFQI